MKEFFRKHKRKLLILSLFLVAGTNTYIGFQNNEPRVFNILNYGAKGDGIRITGAAMGITTTTLTCANANFTAADVGKWIRVPGAGSSGHDLITTIATFVNSTTVTLTASSVGAVSNKQVVYGTDNTAAIQNAIWADSANGGGEVYVPKGIFVVAGSLVTSAFGANPNSQLYFPVAAIGTGTFQNRTHYIIRGETPPEFVPMNFPSDTLAALSGSVIYSIIDGSGNIPAVFGTKAAGAAPNINYAWLTFRNLSIYVAQNVSNGGPSMSGINGYYTASVITDNVLVSADGSIGNSVQPTNEVFGIVGCVSQSEIQTRFTNTQVENFKYGYYISDDAVVDNSCAVICQYALVLGLTTENEEISYFKAYWNNNDIYIPNSTIGGYILSGANFFHVNNLVSEVFSASGHWYDYSKILVDAGNNGTGDINYTIIQAAGTWANNLYNQTGGANIISRAIGTVPFGTRGYYTLGAPFQQGDMNIQSKDASNNFIGFNTQLIGSNFQSIRTAAAAKIGFGNGGSIFMSTAASVTGGTTQTYGFTPFYVDNTGHVQLGNNVNFTPSSYTDFAPSTTTNASINIPPGTAPSAANAGDIWNNSSSNLLQARINGITLQLGCIIGQTTLISGTKTISISGITTSSKAFVTLVTPSGVTLTTSYQAVCTSNTLTIQSNVAAGTINTSDGSTLNYQVYP